ncbi:peptide-methionine (R)-S-oxide reductase MsrB [Alterisphingorhabdus coralli]|uniref:peptide-methionine (R)-S-oxide reductase n=1 Tax=Alterisphingorhabdus coralli TaxID=3071408 RepID=A0AA97F8J1_9SPHN|nr:peptide-methionine (R)-S-oxide reductase MsrB [Parasphingorhabdus sp. SCSIO 66989]WOE75471.1 peptide-methionine (R)-S-oxide reductase MsrB [Parasphingorhabdus sp. SCSIO 66989]
MATERRHILAGLAAGGVIMAGLGVSRIGIGAAPASAKGKRFPISRSDAEWKKRLTPMQYYVLRQEGTERAFTSRLNKEKRSGTFLCAGCNHPVFRSADKYDSGTGWPSFTRAVSANIGTSTDYKIGVPRTEVHCSRCGGHLGHVFNDGPRPTGKRWCINGAALRFRPA